ncbi:DUF2884 family protein [Microbulbifer salipaludis]|uniref:DUF2884 family protein n=1 Tax=Microbulbifer salipaludis TaxID=187980 RepID=A0ABS3E3Y1_9GAMM|nr:DUF2884 family protein [Microbulbifer salipaludis]MBN8430020.1 DUF2884 family protein [Microbulbifer salipaludis]
MKNALIFLSVAALSAPLATTAGEISLMHDTDQQCSMRLHHSTRVSAEFFEVIHDDSQQILRYVADKPQQLDINGQVITLDTKQQNQLEAYHAGLLQTGKDITNITIDAVDIAMEGVGIALTALAGADHPDSVEFQHAASQVRYTTRDRLRNENGIYVLGDNWDVAAGENIENTIEQIIESELEPRIEKIALQSAGTLTWHALKAVFTGGASIARDAEAAAEAAEAVVQERARLLESRAENLCHNLRVMDTIETDLQGTIPTIATFEVIEQN